jgi:hypothetical protein
VKPTTIVVDQLEISPPYLNRRRENLRLCVSFTNYSQSEGLHKGKTIDGDSNFAPMHC